jgi:hypothetical protein
MNTIRLLAAACLACVAAAAPAAGPSACPQLPEGSALHWQALAGDGFLFCKAMRAGGAEPAFSVMLRDDGGGFSPRRSSRVAEAVIDGHDVWWHAGEVATQSGVVVREARVELDDGRHADISLRAADDEAARDAMALAEMLRFDTPEALSRN